MPNFRAKPYEVEAELFDGTEDCVKRLSAWMQDCLLYKPHKQTVVVSTLAGDLSVAAGEWIIRTPGGGFVPVSARTFAESYEPVP